MGNNTFKCISCGMLRQDSQSCDYNISICIFCADPENNIPSEPEPDCFPQCKHCLSEDVIMEGKGIWNSDKQEWEYEEAGHFPNVYCTACDDMTKIIWIQL